MQDNNKNRQATPRKRGRGRPKKSDQLAAQPTEPPQEVVPLLDTGRVPPMNCPKCGRGMQPTVLRTMSDGRRKCQCGLCGRCFFYTPPRIE